MQAIDLTQPIAYNARWCNVCLLFKKKNKNIKLSKCSGCNLVQYCSEVHQRIDWTLHKEFCRAVQRITKAHKVSHIFAINNLSTSEESMESRVLQVKLMVRFELGRALHDNEDQLTSYPNICTVCLKTSTLTVCPDCQGVSYCSEKCKQIDLKHHDSICRALRLFYCPYKRKINNPFMANESVDIVLLKRILHLNETNLIDALQFATQKRISDEPYKSLEEFQLFSDMANFSCIATICYTLESAEINCLTSTKFVIFIIGAEEEPSLYFRNEHTKFFFLQYPQITTLELYFIGPNLGDINKNTCFYDFQGQKRLVNNFGYRDSFEEFCKKFNINPSIIVSFNCGFSERAYCNEELDSVFNKNMDSPMSPNEVVRKSPSLDTWHEGIIQIIQTYDVPIVFTSYTLMEAQFDYGVIARAVKTDTVTTTIDRILSIHQNPYRDPRAIRNIVTADDEEIYYRNGYIQSILTRPGAMI